MTSGACAACAVCLLALCCAAGFGQVPDASSQKPEAPEVVNHELPPSSQIKVERNLVTVRVVVRDSKGRTVGNLHKEDFRLFDSGKPQEISGFEVETASPKAAEALPPQPAKPGEAPQPPAAAPAPAPQRFVGLFFDDLHMSIEEVGRTREAAARYLATAVRPQDRVAVFTSSGKGNMDFSDDRAKLHEALLRLAPRSHVMPSLAACPEIGEWQAYLIDQLHVRNQIPGPLGVAVAEAILCDNCQDAGSPQIGQRRSAQIGGGGSCREQEERRVEAEAADIWRMAEIQSQDSLQAIEAAVRRLAVMPGQRSVVLVSSGFLTMTCEAEIDALINRALRQDVVISAIDAAGLYAYEPRHLYQIVNFQLEEAKNQLKHTGMVFSRDVLANLAAGTGGVFFHNSNDFDEGFRETAAVPEVYYVLTFSPPDINLDGKFHPLKVKLNTPGPLTVEARRGYFASQTALAGQASTKDELEKVVFSLDELHVLPADVTTQVEKLSEQEYTLTVVIHMDLRRLQFHKEADRSVNTLIFDSVLFDRDGKYVTGKESSLELRVKDETLAKFAQSGIKAETIFHLAPGTYRLREVVRDTESKGMSALNSDVQVPR